jgi:hypothetical protein
MLRCGGRVITIFALCCAIGLHWVALQSVAWTTMVIEHAKQQPLSLAISQTFDGNHPCSLCRAVNTGSHSEKKPDVQQSTLKIDMICAIRTVGLLPPFVPFDYKTNSFSFSEGGQSPLVPPPRPLLV